MRTRAHTTPIEGSSPQPITLVLQGEALEHGLHTFTDVLQCIMCRTATQWLAWRTAFEAVGAAIVTAAFCFAAAWCCMCISTALLSLQGLRLYAGRCDDGTAVAYRCKGLHAAHQLREVVLQHLDAALTHWAWSGPNLRKGLTQQLTHVLAGIFPLSLYLKMLLCSHVASLGCFRLHKRDAAVGKSRWVPPKGPLLAPACMTHHLNRGCLTTLKELLIHVDFVRDNLN